MDEKTTRQALFQHVVNAVRRGQFGDAERQLDILERQPITEIERKLLDSTKQLFSNSFNNQNLITNALQVPIEKTCGKYFRFPDRTGRRRLEGGARCRGLIKSDKPGEPLVSVITVCRNSERTIASTLQSIQEQTYSNVEHIVIDGLSADHTLDVITSHTEVDYLLCEPDNGIYNAMNKGLALANGRFVVFLNADDVFLSDAVSSSVQILEKHDADLSYANFQYFDERGIAVISDEGRAWREAMLVEGIMGGHETCFVRRDAYDLIGPYDESYKLAADYHWMCRAFMRGLRGQHLNKNILLMRTGGKSFNAEQEKRENERILKEVFPNLSAQKTSLLYDLKYYHHWHGNSLTDQQLIDILTSTVDESTSLQRATLQSVCNRKIGTLGRLTPAENPKTGKLKIAIALTYATDMAGGAERIAIDAANELSRRGHAVTFVSCHGLAGETYYPLDHEIAYIDLAISPYKDQYFAAGQDIAITQSDWADVGYPELDHFPTEEDVSNWATNAHLWKTKIYGGFLRTHDFDVVLSHMPSTFPYTLFASKALDSKPKQIACLHNSPKFKFFSSEYPAESDTDRHMRLASLKYADRITTLFDQHHAQMPDSYRSKCRTVTNFLSPQLVDEAENFAPTDRENIILSVGRLVPQKNHTLLIQAYAMLRRKHPDWELHIYGDGPLRSVIESQCRDLGLNPEKILKGTTKDVGSIYKTAKVFAFPSSFEGFGLTALEAMTHALPVVALQDCDGVKYIVKHDINGLLVDREGGPSAFCFALQSLVENNETRTKFGDAAKLAAKTYTISDHVDRLEELFYDDLGLSHSTSSAKKTTETMEITETNMSCAILSTYSEGGAGIAAERLHDGLRHFNHDAMLVGFSSRQGHSSLSTKLEPDVQQLYDLGQRLFAPPLVKPGNALFSSSIAGLSKSQTKFLKTFDIINLHWIENLLSIDSIYEIVCSRKPIVWTLHDMKPFTGGCHYSGSCIGYERDCAKCPQLGPSLAEYPEKVLGSKRDRFTKNITIVTPSHWLAECARRSSVFRDNRVEVIPNGLDLTVFKPHNMSAARRALGLHPTKNLILFACHDHHDRRKGFAELVQVSKILADRNENTELVTLGHESDSLAELKLPYKTLGFISEPRKLSQVYSAVNATALPTLEDNLPNIILESVACGTPVVAFDSGGVRDVVVDGVTGYLSERKNCEHLAEQIIRASQTGALADSCRRYAIMNFSHLLQAQRYIDLFCELRQETILNDINMPQLPGTTSDLAAQLSRAVEDY